jgi:thiol-disulfide isomerase/thioredoxin
VLLVPAVLAVLAVLVAGCTSPEQRLADRVDVDTPALRSLKADAGIEQCPRPRGTRATQAPDVVLPCLGGGPEVALRSVAGPAVLNVWAQWCGPCRAELPLFQRLHERAGDRLRVLGIDWQDTQPASALQLAQASGVTYPLVADPGALVSDAWRVDGLPVTVFVDARGRTTVHRGRIADWHQLAGLVADHTGVRVAAG